MPAAHSERGYKKCLSVLCLHLEIYLWLFYRLGDRDMRETETERQSDRETERDIYILYIKRQEEIDSVREIVCA